MLSELGEKIFRLKYSRNKEESWEEMCLRVASHVAEAEHESEYGKFLKLFFQMIVERKVLPGGRILTNAGTKIKNLYNCFVLPVEDSRDGIYTSLHDAAEIFAWGGGIGYNFSDLRERGALINSTGGEASGPVSFMQLFDTTGEVIQQASRRGAQMGMLDIDHPDILEFISSKSKLNDKHQRYVSEIAQYTKAGPEIVESVEKILADNQLSHFNISVAITDEFMNAVVDDEAFELKSRGNGESTVVRARDLMNYIAMQAWESGDPGLYFVDNANEDNLLANYLQIRATNPCGEVGLFPYEPCNLASINLCEMMNEEKDAVDLEKLAFFTQLAIRFLDDVHDMSENLIENINKSSRYYRRVGLGVMGFADVLAEMEVPYDSEEAREIATVMAATINKHAWSASHYLALERGSFPAMEDYEDINWVMLQQTTPELVGKPLRNVSVTAIAPTGTIALISDVNSGIEPFFSLGYVRHITEGIGNQAKDSVVMGNHILRKKLMKEFDNAETVDAIMLEVAQTGTIQNSNVPQWIKDVFKTANEISYVDHIRMQASWQPYISNSISKTVNMPEEATAEDVLDAYTMAWAMGCKGITIYRDKSKSFQILNSGN